MLTCLCSLGFGSGFLSGRPMQAITYHAIYGEISRMRVAMTDGVNTKYQAANDNVASQRAVA